MSFDYPDYGEPEALAGIRAQLSEQDRIDAFARVFGREPSNNEELGDFIELYTLELYNHQMDANPNFDPRL